MIAFTIIIIITATLSKQSLSVASDRREGEIKRVFARSLPTLKLVVAPFRWARTRKVRSRKVCVNNIQFLNFCLVLCDLGIDYFVLVGNIFQFLVQLFVFVLDFGDLIIVLSDLVLNFLLLLLEFVFLVLDLAPGDGNNKV